MPVSTLTLRLVKGTPLTAAEMDGNLTKLRDFANSLETLVLTSLNADGTLKRPLVVRGASSNGTDDYAISVSGSYSALSDLAGTIIILHADVSCNPTSTSDFARININSLGLTNIKKFVGVNLARGDIRPNQEAILTYDPVNNWFILHNPATNSRENYSAATLSGSDYSITLADFSGVTFEIPDDYYVGYTVMFTPSGAPATPASATLAIKCTTPSINLGPKALKKIGSTDLQAGDLVTDHVYIAVYDGTRFQVLNTEPDPLIYRSASTAIIAGDSGGIAGLTGVSHGLGTFPDFVNLFWVCKAAINGYSIGDILPIGAIFGRNAAANVMPLSLVVVLDAAGLLYTVIKSDWSGANAIILTKSTGAQTTITEANIVASFNIKVVMGRYTR